MTAPTFYDTDYDAIRSRLVARFEELSGRTLLPAQPESLLLDAAAYEIVLIAQQNQAASSQMLLAFANAPALDYLADLQGVTRQGASAASVNVQFTFASGHGGFTLPGGTRVGAENGRATFAVDGDLVVTPGATTATVTATSITFGATGNDFALGQITRLIDRRPEMLSVTNVSVSGGGADLETDDELRERVRLASASFSVAGPAKAYAYHARTASPSIIDVSVTTPIPGTVNVYPLVQGGTVTSETVLDLVRAALDPDTVVPLTDTVAVISPERVEVPVSIELVLYTDADPIGAVDAARQRVAKYLLEREQTLGLDVTLSQLVARAIDEADEVADATVTSPTMDIVLDPTQFAKTISLTLTVTGTTDG